MKTRNGFVSNSSSSSFIVAFPKMPKSDKDVLKFMFDGKEGGVSLEYNDQGLSYAQVAKIVFDDIENDNAKKGDMKILIEEVMGRYYYHTNGGSMSWNGEADGNGTWPEKRGRYFGSDHDLMEALKQATIDDAKTEEIFNEKERAIEAKSGIKRVAYAYKGGIDPYTKKPYTNVQIKARENYEKELKAFHETAVWVDFQKERRVQWNSSHTKLNDIRTQLAKADIKNFLADNKGKYIFVAKYADDEGWIGGTMEHGNIFRNVPHIKISNH